LVIHHWASYWWYIGTWGMCKGQDPSDYQSATKFNLQVVLQVPDGQRAGGVAGGDRT
jgi:hypothetical protein